jgi:hypothetical protein
MADRLLCILFEDVVTTGIYLIYTSVVLLSVPRVGLGADKRVVAYTPKD